MTNFELGVCTWTFGDQPLATTAQQLAALGFDGVELLGDLDLYSTAQAQTILSDHGLQVFSLTPANVDISHPDAGIRQAAVEYFFRLLDFAAELGNPLVSCHGVVGRIAPIVSQATEDELLIDSVRQITQQAQTRNLQVVFEVLNRYETHQIHTGKQALALVEAVGASNLGVLLDAYHMNIEEANPSQAIRDVGDQLWLYHTADSNRQALGRGHTDIATQVAALGEIGYQNPIILEVNAPGANPFTPNKGQGWRDVLLQFLGESHSYLRTVTT